MALLKRRGTAENVKQRANARATPEAPSLQPGTLTALTTLRREPKNTPPRLSHHNTTDRPYIRCRGDTR